MLQLVVVSLRFRGTANHAAPSDPLLASGFNDVKVQVQQLPQPSEARPATPKIRTMVINVEPQFAKDATYRAVTSPQCCSTAWRRQEQSLPCSRAELMQLHAVEDVPSIPKELRLATQMRLPGDSNEQYHLSNRNSPKITATCRSVTSLQRLFDCLAAPGTIPCIHSELRKQAFECHACPLQGNASWRALKAIERQ